MAAETPDMSAITFLIFAWVIISWPFRMPPSSSPMMTSTIAISTSVKPVCLAFIALSLGVLLVRNPHATIVIVVKQGVKSQPRVRSVEMPTMASEHRHLALLKLLQPLLEKAQLRGIGNFAARQQATQHDARGLELVHVLEDEDL